ncbi:dihydrolipoyl dehydrogenase family protein [Euzebya rosea]|uniref:dihydrolipoyl dehydrogenase family protein n=1 Tax=Euzebya rosea TaxID=2052804 RepID=UPI001475D377|nr:NAD(P)/FAD-dependent oxidoreductase [Euzebya rosea]
MPTTDMPEHVRVAVLGGGSAAERLAGLLASGGVDVAVVERHLVGGECPYYACIPSKVMLLTAAARHAIGRAHDIGAAAAPLDAGDGAEAYRTAARRRDDAAANHDDRDHVRSLEDKGVHVIRGEGRVCGPGRLSIDTDDGPHELGFDELVLATGSTVVVPDIPGLADAEPWTFVEAWTATERPASMLVIGGGAVGCEIAQAHVRFGTAVTLVEGSELMGGGVEPETAEDLAALLRADGVDVRTQAEVTRVDPAGPGEGWRVTVDGGDTVTVERIVVATGKAPVVDGLGLEHLGLDPGEDLAIDEACRVRGVDHLWAIGDVTTIAPFTHTANHQGWVAAQNLLGRPTAADHRGIPRTVYTSPELAAVGITRARAEEEGHDVVHVTFDLGDTARGSVDPEDAGRLVLVADRSSRLLLGASLLAPAAGESISEFALAIRAEVDVDRLAELIHPFPTWSEGFGYALHELRKALDR